MRSISEIKTKMDSGKEAKKFKDIIDNIDIIDEIRDGYDLIARQQASKITLFLNKYANKGQVKFDEAKNTINGIKSEINSLNTSFKVLVNDLLREKVINYSNNLLEEYKKKLSNLSADMKNIGDEFNSFTFKIMEGDLSAVSIDSIIKDNKESIKTGSEKRTRKKEGFEHITRVAKTWNPFSRNFWSKDNWNFTDEIVWYEDVYSDFVDMKKVCKDISAPIQKVLIDKGNQLDTDVENNVQKIKEKFYEKFDELDRILKHKLNELNKFANDRENIEEKIKDLKEKQNWLDDIKKDINSIIEL